MARTAKGNASINGLNNEPWPLNLRYMTIKTITYYPQLYFATLSAIMLVNNMVS